jgi:hypothetical protein
MSLADIMETMSQMGGDLGMDPAELDATMAMFEAMDMSMDYRIEDTIIDMVSWFDAAEGVVARVEAEIPMKMTVSMANIPDAGDIEMAMDLLLDQTMQLTE